MIEVWKKLWPEIKPYRKQFAIVILLGLCTNVFKFAIPDLIEQLMTAWNEKDKTTAFLIPPLVAVAWIFASLFRYFHLYLMKYTADKISLNQRRLLMDKYLSLNVSFFQDFERGSGGLISRMINDIAIILNGIHKTADVFREPFLIIPMMIYLFYKDWKLTLFIVIALPIVTAVMRRIAISLRKHSRRSQEAMEDLTRTLKESLDGTRVVQSFLLEDEIRRKFNSQADLYLQSRKKIISREEASGPITESLSMFFYSLLLLYIGHLVFDDNFTTADFMGFMVSLGMIQDSSRKLQDGYIKIQQAVVGLERFYSILQTENPVMSPREPVAFPQSWSEIEFKNVSFAYKNELVLKNINLRIQRNQKVALVGSSGSGKSTLVNLLQRFFDPTEGQVLIDGIPINHFSLNDLRRNIALVTQDVFLFNDTIEKNILMGQLQASHDDVVRAAQLANAEKFIQNTPKGYETNVGDFGSRMSGGEKQRVSIARAILKNSPILVLDEATSALDSESELEVQKGLNSLMQGRTAFMIAHRLSTIANADRILVLKKGEIVEDGNHSHLLEKKGEYYKFHQMQLIE